MRCQFKPASVFVALCQLSNYLLDSCVSSEGQTRESKWTESIAVGSKSFIEATIKRVGARARGRRIAGNNKTYEVREPGVPSGVNFTTKNALLRHQNTYFWRDTGRLSIG